MAFARRVGPGFFPLDEELELLPGGLTPHLHECLVRLGAWIPSFDAAGALLQALTGAYVSEPGVRRKTEAAGAAYVAWQTEEVERIERALPLAPPGPAKALLSVDGVMVPLLHGEWAEVRTLVMGEIQAPVKEKDGWVVHADKLSYFSRLTDADAFCRLALVETQRRGLENAGQVAAVTDGAEWEQKFIDFHREDAVRILDFPHAAERISQCGAVIYGEGAPESQAWLKQRLHALKHEGPTQILTELRELQNAHPQASLLRENLAYLEKREPHMHYPTYQAEGLPLASGAVESGNKLVVEARLKGAGMHWQRAHVDPMLALRNLVCSDRWAEDWPQIASRLRQEVAHRRASQRARRRAQATPHLAETSLPPGPTLEREGVCQPVSPPALPIQPIAPRPTTKKAPYRPGPDHPWRHSPIGRARYWTDSWSRLEKT